LGVDRYRTPNVQRWVVPVAESLTTFQMFINGEWTQMIRNDVPNPFIQQ